MPDPKKKSNKPKIVGMPTRRQITLKRGFGGSSNVGDYSTHEAPRVGGPAQPSIGVPVGGTRKQLRKSIRSVRQNAASKQAKRSAKKLY